MRIPIVPSVSRPEATRDSVELRPGQIYRATVVEQVEGGALLRLGGVLIRAESDIPLQNGTLLTVQAEQRENGLVLLRLLPQPVEGSAPSPSAAPLESTLSQLGLPINQVNLAAAKALFNWFQPVTGQDVAQLTREAQLFETSKQTAYLNIRGWTKAAGLPQDKATVNVVTRFLLGEAEPEQVPAALSHINQAEPTPVYPDVSVLWWHNSRQHGEIYLFEDEAKSPEEQVNLKTLALRVSTVNLGEVWLRFAFKTPELDVAFVSPRETTLSLLRQRQPVLKDVITALGLQLKRVHYRQDLPSSFLDVVPLEQDHNYSGLNLLV